MRDGFPKSLVLARHTDTNACNRAHTRDLFAIAQAYILVSGTVRISCNIYLII
jgi:hypothetical protein